MADERRQSHHESTAGWYQGLMKDISASATVVCTLPLRYVSEGLCAVCSSTDTNFLPGSLTFRGGCGRSAIWSWHKEPRADTISCDITGLWIGYNEKTISPVQHWRKRKSRAMTTLLLSVTDSCSHSGFISYLNRGRCAKHTFTCAKFFSMSDFHTNIAVLVHYKQSWIKQWIKETWTRSSGESAG